MNAKLAELFHSAVSESVDFETYKNTIVATLSRAPEDACQTIIRAIKRTIKSRSETPAAKLKALKILHASMLTANSHLITYAGKKIMRRLTVLARHKKVDSIQDSTDPKRGYNLFGHSSTNSIQNQQISIEFLTALLKYIQIWGQKFGNVFMKSYETLIKDKVSFPVVRPKVEKRPVLPSNPANIVGLQEDMVTCIEAAHQLKEILNSGSETNSRKVKSLAKRVNAYKNQIEAHIETGLGGELNEDGLNVLLYANDVLGDAIKTYEANSSNLARPATSVHASVSPPLLRSATVMKADSVRSSQNVSLSPPISEFHTVPVGKLPKDKPLYMPDYETIPSEILKARAIPQAASLNEPVPKPIPDPPSNNSSMMEDSCSSPTASLSSPMRFENSSFSQSIKFVRIIQEFSLEDRQFLDTPDRNPTTPKHEDRGEEYLKKIDEMTTMLKNQENALEVQTSKLQKKSEKIKELKKTKFELDAYITNINSKYEKLKEDTISLKEAQEHISALKHLIEQKENRIDENLNQIKDMEDYIEDMKKLIVDKETEIVQKNDQIAEFEIYVEKINSTVETKQSEVEELNSVIKTKDRYIDDMKDEVAVKSNLMRELSEELTIKEEYNQDLLNTVKAYNDKILSYKRKILILKEKLQDKDRQLEDEEHHKLIIENLEDRQTDRRTVTVMLQTPKIRTVPSTPHSEKSIFARYLEKSEELVTKSHEFLKPQRRYTISPATIAYGDSESAQLNESDMSHSDRSHSDRSHSDRSHSDRSHSDRDHSEKSIEISPEAENNEEKSEVTLELEETPTSDLQSEVPLRQSITDNYTRTSLVSVYMEEPPILNECSSQNPFKSPEEQDEVMTESPLIFSQSPEVDLKPDNLDMYRFCVNRLKSVLYSNDLIEVGIQVAHEQGKGTAQLYIGNKSDYPIDNLESRLINRDSENLEIEINTEIELITLEKMEKLERLISFEITGELSEPPLLLLKYLSNNTLYKVSLLLPITIALCFDVCNLDPSEIMSEWNNSKYSEKLKEFEGLQEHIKSMRELAWFLHMGGRVKIFSYREVESLSQRTIIFACIYKGEKVFYMVKLNETATGGEICLRAENCKLQDSIIPLLISLIS